MGVERALRVVLVDVNAEVVAAWRSAFADTPEVEIQRGSILDVDVDAWVSPTNARGRMDGGVDAVVKRHLGAGIQVRVQRAIRDRFGGGLPVGSAVCVPSGAVVPRYLISTPTMRQSSQNISETMNVALACAAAFQAVHLQNREQPGSIRSVALVGLGAQTGRVPAGVCANLMWTGYTLFQDHGFADYDELRAAVLGQLDDIEGAGAVRRVRISVPEQLPPSVTGTDVPQAGTGQAGDAGASPVDPLQAASDPAGASASGAAGSALANDVDVPAAGGTGTPAGDPLGLAELFTGGGEPWLPLLGPVIEAQPSAADFIGPKRSAEVVPVRELTFQALKPHPPQKWKVVAFGQNPYPRPESATGIAMFDNTFGDWKDSQFGRVVSMRCIIKAAAMWKYGIPKKTPIAEVRALLKKEDTVQPPEWFQAMLTQGVLLLNASLTASADGAMPTDRHTSFWRPVAEQVVEEILRAKQDAEGEDRGVVFAWWGAHARSLKRAVQRLEKKYPGVEVRHLDHANPAAQGDIFCEGDHFAQVNDALAAVGTEPVDWLPRKGWDQRTAEAGGPDGDGVAKRMGAFITSTMELHQLYLERLTSAKDEGLVLPPVTGVFDTPLMDFRKAVEPVTQVLAQLDRHIERSSRFGEAKATEAEHASGLSGEGLSADAISALYLYTCESAFYREINAVLRSPDRERLVPYLPYLRLLFSAVTALPAQTRPLWRGVALDLRSQYPLGRTVAWWGVSSCTSELSVARAFLGSRGRRTLFEVTPARAVGIRRYSAFTGEEEYILAPGTQLKVTEVKAERGGLCTVRLTELEGQGLVS
ncbi:ADP-ribosyltransferase domain-containing protein [Streptomyces sp. SP18CS02]|uniref:ADP-ribosyltransferase domain-containing protein n=1 Tax=Streptomyces sp. SP18CS02 TaxID=3002531 RepID=UPI002E782C10|nr:ADP-ribosyltransferase domain-containing protein [Streptomyces sp. SP18CS02]MEE1753131.1 ADP-ribosyltransferase domain-containing protein [Streptomyces sp. SP18CS02]